MAKRNGTNAPYVIRNLLAEQKDGVYIFFHVFFLFFMLLHPFHGCVGCGGRVSRAGDVAVKTSGEESMAGEWQSAVELQADGRAFCGLFVSGPLNILFPSAISVGWSYEKGFLLALCLSPLRNSASSSQMAAVPEMRRQLP